MTEILTQDEINSLLDKIQSGEPDEMDFTRSTDTRQVSIYDFRRPDRLKKEQLRSLRFMHEAFARLSTTTLSAHLRCMVGVQIGSVDQMTLEEFLRSIPNPTTLALLNMDPLRGSAILEIDPGLVFAICCRLFGGSGDPAKISRELTDIERSVMESVIVRLLGCLRESWSCVLDLRPRLGNIETDPNFAQIVSPNEMITLISFETSIGEVEGMLNLCLPWVTIEPIAARLSRESGVLSLRPAEVSRRQQAEKLRRVIFTLQQQFACDAVPVGRLGELTEGCSLTVNDRPGKTMFEAGAVEEGGEK